MRYNTLTSISHGGDCMAKGVVYVAEVTDPNIGEKVTNTGLTDGTMRDRISKPESNREHGGGKIHKCHLLCSQTVLALCAQYVCSQMYIFHFIAHTIQPCQM